ncbi:MAG: AsnC family transcriptional regulator [Hyphomicrobiales bacterium]|nr:MAG: AsnC family transcriptional regulator [Hyphomicrobiales bacterium]
MDRIDRRLLKALQEDCRQPISELAALVALSPSACHRRIKLLEERGVLEGYVARLNGKKMGYLIEFFVEVSLYSQSQDILRQFEDAARRVPEILECHLMTGQADYMLKVAARSTEDYERIHRDCIAQLPNVSRIQSSLVLRTVRHWSGYAVDTA